MHRHGLESVEREVRWLTELIETERTISRERAVLAAADESDVPATPTPSPEAP